MSLTLWFVGLALAFAGAGCLYAPLAGSAISCPPPRWHHRAFLAGVGLIVASAVLAVLAALL